ncbi:alkaline phosphatase [Leucobacter sp. wl10]|nr:alkaline phosphatase [Leucobacter sp. wl10]
MAALMAGSGLLLAAPANAVEGDRITDNGGAARLDGDRTQALRDALVDGPAKNVILIIGDGMGDSEITVARNYTQGASGSFAGIDALPLTGQYSTYSVTKDGTVDYASESASTASAWSTGTKAVDGSLSVDYAGNPQSTLLELAKANGKKTGNVSTSAIQDATPGAEVAHISQRGCFGPDETSQRCTPEAVENGGLGSISEQLLNVRPDVTLGGGSESFNQTAKGGQWKGRTLVEQAQERGYQLVNDAAGLNAVTAADQQQPLLGLFADGNFPVRWQGPQATVGGGDLAPQACTPNPERLDTGLSLGSLTSKAIGLLDNQKGFFLQVEGASIDKQDHAANACGQIGETVDLDEAVQSALDFAKTNGDTLVLVSADHAHTSQILGSTPPGASVNLLTQEGQSMIVGYTNAEPGSSMQHTGSQVRVAGYGPGAGNVVGLLDQTDMFFISANTLGLNRDLPALSADATISASASEVKPGEEFTVAVEGMDADWQASASLGSEALGQQDVKNGSATFTVTAPKTLGEQTVTVTGSKTGTSLSTAVSVVETPAPAPAPGPEQPSDPPAGAGGGSGGGGGPLATTGAQLPILLAVIALLALGGGAAIVARRRRVGMNL